MGVEPIKPILSRISGLSDPTPCLINPIVDNDGAGSSMKIRCIIWALVVALISVTVFQNALADLDQNASVNNSSLNNTMTPAAEITSVEGVWKVTLANTEITRD